MKIYRFKRRQLLPITLEKAWDFLSDPKNLKLITPEYMGFNIINEEDTEMYAGQIIQYIVTPVLGIPTKWVTEITQVKDKKYFVDEQRFGPYSLWHHKHFIKEVKGGVEMIDIIDYKIPLGLLGRIMNPILVKPKLEEIFRFRKEKLEETFWSIKKMSEKVNIFWFRRDLRLDDNIGLNEALNNKFRMLFHYLFLMKTLLVN